MGLISSLIKNLRLFNQTAGSRYNPRYGNTTAGEAVSEMSAMQLTAVYACVRILSESVASLPFHLYRYTKNRSKEKAIDHPLYRILHSEPNDEMTSFIWRETMMAHILLWGNAYSQIIRNGKGEVLELWPLMANRMSVDRDEKTNKIIYTYDASKVDKGVKVEKKLTFKKEEILHIPGLGFDGLVGYSPIAMAKNAVGMAQACEKYGSKFFNNGALPGGVLTHPSHVDESKADELRERWRSLFGGANNSNRIAVLEDGMKFEPISINPNEAQFLETRKFQLNEIARIFRIPPHMIGDLEKSSFNNMEEQSLEFVKYTLEPWLIRWEQGIEKALLTIDEKKTYFVKFNLDGLLRGDYESRMKGYSIGIQNGFMSPNDIRNLESLDEIPDEEGGNMYMVNGNMLPLKKAGAWYDETYEDEKDGKSSEESDDTKNENINKKSAHKVRAPSST